VSLLELPIQRRENKSGKKGQKKSQEHNPVTENDDVIAFPTRRVFKASKMKCYLNYGHSVADSRNYTPLRDFFMRRGRLERD